MVRKILQNVRLLDEMQGISIGGTKSRSKLNALMFFLRKIATGYVLKKQI